MRRKGRRIVYIPYGIEIVKTPQANIDHFKRQVVQNAWRVYTFSPQMREEYFKYISPNVIKSLGHPKFDKLSDRSIEKNATILDQAAGKKIILLKLHWTKIQDGKQFTPELSVYLEFLERLALFDAFFVIMLHPNFLYNALRYGDTQQQNEARQIVAISESALNATVCTNMDYRSDLASADCVITDRSSIMVEAGILDIPVLYMTGASWETLSDQVEPIVMSYYQGKTSDDMVRFVKMCLNNQDPKRFERRAAVAEYLPLPDGKSGERIANDMVDGVMNGN